MFAHLDPQVSGWWDGVLHPMEFPVHLVTMLLVGLLGGLGVRSGRSSWAHPVLFITAVVMCGMAALGLNDGLYSQPAMYALAAAVAVMVFVNPRHTTVVAPLVVTASGALHGFGHGAGIAATSSRLGYLAGFVFTSGLLLAVSAIVGIGAGHAIKNRRSRSSSPTAVDDRALV